MAKSGCNFISFFPSYSLGGVSWKMLKWIISLFIFPVLLLMFSGFSKETTQDMPKDFNFSLTYGTYGKQKIDTFNDLVVKDLVKDGTVEAHVALTEDEMKQIYKKMHDLNIMGDLNLEDEEECDAEPPSPSRWNIQMNGQTKSFSYSTYCEHPNEVLELLKLEEMLHNIVLEKDEYKQLPKANGFYE